MTQSTILDAAYEYIDRGWSVIPCKPRTKQAAVKWQKWQAERPDRRTVQRWFRAAAPPNLSIVMGDVSGGLVARDFDEAREYTAWASNHPDLAHELPTVCTGRGFHVYARMDPCPRVRSSGVTAGELRANGGYVMAPPSTHPSGSAYHWTVTPKGELPVVSTSDLDLDHLESSLFFSAPHVTEPAEPTEPTQPIEPAETTDAMRGGGCVGEETMEAIFATIPTSEGIRNNLLFELARRVKAIHGDDLGKHTLKAILDEWWKRAKSKVGTKDYGLALREFLRAYNNAHTPYGETMENFLKLAAQSPPPAWVPADCMPGTRLLASLCRELQRAAGDDPFYLSTHVAGKLLGVKPMIALRWLELLTLLDGIEVVEKGKSGGKKATRYRYVAPDLYQIAG